MLTHARIKLIKSLSDKAARTETGLFTAEGEKLVMEALESGWETEAVYYTEKFRPESLPAAAPAEKVTSKEMERISHLKTPSGILALMRIPPGMREEDISGKALTLVLDGIRDPGNLGTILRLADWFGIKDVVCSPESADCYNPKVVQATMGALFRVRVDYRPLPEFLKTLAAAGIPVYGTFLEGENVYSAQLSPGGAVVIGNEGKGISPEVADHVGRRLFIPPYPESRSGSESLNAAMATGIICSEFRRRLTR